MNPAIRTLGFILLLFCILSFHKHPNAAPGPDGTKLYKVYMWNSSQPNRDIDLFEYYYDNLDRVTEIRQYLIDSVNGNLQSKYIKSQTCFYNADEQLPYKTRGFHYYAENEIYYFYDNQERVITDSMIGKDGLTTVNKYIWYSDKVFRTWLAQVNPRGYFRRKDSSVINNHNITSTVLTEHGASHIAYTNAVFTYDNKENPINTINICPIFSGLSWPYASHDQRVSGYNKNNITEITLGKSNFDGVFIPKFKFTYTYKYNRAGLPVECEVSGVPFSNNKNRIQYYCVD